MDQEIILKANFKIFWTEQKWKHDLLKLVRCIEISSYREFIALNAYIRKKETNQ